MKRFFCGSLTAALVLFASFASAQDKDDVSVESVRKVSSLFEKASSDESCSQIVDNKTWQCLYRGHGLRQIAVRATILTRTIHE